MTLVSSRVVSQSSKLFIAASFELSKQIQLSEAEDREELGVRENVRRDIKGENGQLCRVCVLYVGMS